jgi:hypothetical protein
VARIVVIIPESAGEALIDLADREWRRVGDQAALFVVEGLRRAGALPPPPSAPASADAATEGNDASA